MLPGLFQVFGCGAAIEQWIEPWKWWRWPSADHWCGCDWASERRKELQKHAPDRETAGDMLPLSASPAGTYLSLASLPPSGEGEDQPLFLAIRINGWGSTRLIRLAGRLKRLVGPTFMTFLTHLYSSVDF